MRSKYGIIDFYTNKQTARYHINIAHNKKCIVATTH